jgi:hypothetical protein
MRSEQGVLAENLRLLSPNTPHMKTNEKVEGRMSEIASLRKLWIIEILYKYEGGLK